MADIDILRMIVGGSGRDQWENIIKKDRIRLSFNVDSTEKAARKSLLSGLVMNGFEYGRI